MESLKRVVGRLNSLVEGLGLLLLLAMVLIVCWQVFSRWVLGVTPPWSEETTILLMVWVGFLATAVGFATNSHIALQVFASKMSPSAQIWLDRAIAVLIFLFGAFLIFEGARFVALLGSATLPATQLPLAATYVVAPISGLLICASAVSNFADAGRESEGPDTTSGQSVS